MTRRGHLITIRTAAPADAEALAQIDAESWPAPLATTVDQWRSRLEAFAEGQLVIDYDGQAAVVAAAQRITEAFLHAGPMTHQRLTDGGTFARSHDPLGEIYQLVAVGASAVVNGLGLGRKLIDRQIEQARALPGIKRIIGLTRPARYHRHPELSIEEYAEQRNKTGRRYDPVLEFHLGAGAKLVSTHADFRPDDDQARGYGVLIEYAV
jgi:predicted N-acetyltransferase YhbS